MRSMATAATGMKAMTLQVDVIANNLANINTTGFKRGRALVQDLCYQQLRQPGTTNGMGNTNPSGVQIGLGVQAASTMDVFEQGDFEPTSRDLDVAIRGRGFFSVKIYDDLGEGVGYTRDGSFFINANGDMVLGGPDGFLLEPQVTVPTDYLTIDITPDGQVNVTTPGSVTPTTAGVIQLANFTNPEGLIKVGSNMYVRSASSGDPTISDPGSEGAGTLVQQYLEKSNVDAVRELTSLIEAQRAFELNSRVIETSDEMLQVVNNLKA